MIDVMVVVGAAFIAVNSELNQRGLRTFTILRFYDSIHDYVSCDLTFGCTPAPYVGAATAAVAYQMLR